MNNKIFYADFQNMALDMEKEGYEDLQINEVLDELKEKLDLGSIPGAIELNGLVFVDQNIAELYKTLYGINFMELDLQGIFQSEASSIYAATELYKKMPKDAEIFSNTDIETKVDEIVDRIERHDTYEKSIEEIINNLKLKGLSAKYTVIDPVKLLWEITINDIYVIILNREEIEDSNNKFTLDGDGNQFPKTDEEIVLDLINQKLEQTIEM